MANSVQIVFLRHGQSTWNQQNIFIGMTDTPLTNDGKREAAIAGQLLKRDGFKFDAVYTSLLSRSISTVWIALEEIGTILSPTFTENLRSHPDMQSLNRGPFQQDNNGCQLSKIFGLTKETTVHW
jgi:2,3-bisphosphoglycerate-dependent phosphoglycerate mutase